MIKCVHCGSRLEEQPAGAPAAGVSDGVPATPSGAHATRPSAPDRPPAPPPSVFDPPKPPSPDPWVTPAERHGRTPPPALTPVVVAPGAGAARAPVSTAAPGARARAPRRVDLGLLAAGALALASAAVALTSLSLPWITGTLATRGPRDTLRQVAELPFFADDALVRHGVLGLAVVVGALGLLWFWYGLDRGVQLPPLAHPGLGLLAGVLGWGLVAVARLGALVWETGFLAHARDAGLTREAMRTLLEDRNRRVLTFAAEVGITRFAIAASIALVAGLLAWWTQRER